MSWTVGVDVGGTFTDFFVSDLATGDVYVHKIPSTPDDPSTAILAGLNALRTRLKLPLSTLRRFSHGTTVATNALIERTGGRVAMVTTAGFRDLVEIGRQIRPKVYDLNIDAPAPVVPRERRFEVAERVGPTGAVLVELQDKEIDRVVEDVAAAEVDSCAVCLLFSFINPEHEQRLGIALRKRCPDLRVSLSSEVQPEFREYERFSTTLLNAYLQPRVERYMTHLIATLANEAPEASTGVCQSSGGLMTIARASQMPIRTALSGPAAGVVGAAAVAAHSGRANVITFDMGGTSTDVCLVERGAAARTYDRQIADFPVRLPSIDIHTIGAGGGSIAYVNQDGLLKVGPQSAGAVPGPACYRLGGVQPTVTDANVVLGRLPCELVGGSMRLDPEAATRAIRPIADRLGLSIEDTAVGITRIVVSNMVRAIREVSIERGYDPRSFSLIPFGGAGALHAADVARELGISDILIPSSPGILCAQGAAASDFKEDFVATVKSPLDEDLEAVRAALRNLRERAQAWAERTDNGEPCGLLVTLDMRYIGQNYELSVGVGDRGRHELPGRDVLRKLFFAAHQKEYGHFDPSGDVEIINVRVHARVRSGSEGILKTPGGSLSPVASRNGFVWFEGDHAVTTKIVDRASLRPGDALSGPVVITQFDSTTLVPPWAGVRVDEVSNLTMDIVA